MQQNQIINLQYTTIKEPLPDFIYEDIKDFTKTANIYHPQPSELINKIATKYNIKLENIFLTAGADEAIQLLIKAYGQHVYTFTPTYIVYADAEVFGGKLTRINSLKNNQFEIDTSKKEDSTLIFLANPNNPSGFTEKEKVLELIKNNPHAIVVIDEAYGEFADLSVINEVKHHPNLVVIRSFSKSYGMAGNRIGFVVASKEVIHRIAQFTGWCSVSYLSVGAALSALEHEQYFEKMREQIVLARDNLYSFLLQRHFTVVPSKINCLLLKFDTETITIQFIEFLKKNNIVVSHGNGFSNIGLDKTFVRIAVGTTEQMITIKEVIKKWK